MKHMRDMHSTSKDEIKALQKAGIPMARLEEGVWVAVLPKATGVGPGVLTGGSVELTQGTSTKDH